jgi:hypothetical protein
MDAAARLCGVVAGGGVDDEGVDDEGIRITALQKNACGQGLS